MKFIVSKRARNLDLLVKEISDGLGIHLGGPGPGTRHGHLQYAFTAANAPRRDCPLCNTVVPRGESHDCLEVTLYEAARESDVCAQRDQFGERMCRHTDQHIVLDRHGLDGAKIEALRTIIRNHKSA